MSSIGRAVPQSPPARRALDALVAALPFLAACAGTSPASPNDAGDTSSITTDAPSTPPDVVSPLDANMVTDAIDATIPDDAPDASDAPAGDVPPATYQNLVLD